MDHSEIFLAKINLEKKFANIISVTNSLNRKSWGVCTYCNYK